MNYRDYFRKLDESSAYQEAEQELKILLDLADDILRLRMEKGWSQTELAARAGTKQANISRLESGLSNPSVSFLQKVADALDAGVSIRLGRFVPEIDISTDAVSKPPEAIPAPDWPRARIYSSYDTKRPNGGQDD